MAFCNELERSPVKVLVEGLDLDDNNGPVQHCYSNK